ncbi:helix-turn-helix domain-containing protein [Phenylobacterium soli]|uniref:AraC family transcriptional regulator n=1 Tax=Phenylobacterium soli TaxID=2170551 RepID=A0A328AH28_9CAUL|nr:AraC family transcriptional regulator [Phenylobacterium soli]RAK54050.1 AraC family transcriptional regulator [Phenylobacterium soli]
MFPGPAASPLFLIDLALRSGAAVLLALLAAVLLRDHGRQTAARLGAGFILSALAYVVSSAPGFDLAGPLGWPLGGLAVGVNVLFWLFARALFDDGFRPRPAHAVLWLAIVLMGLVQTASESLGPAPVAAALGTLRAVQAAGFALAAIAQALASWRSDLVEPRRRVRLVVVAAAFAHTILTVIAAVATRGRPAAPERLADVAALAVIALIAAWSLLRTDASGVLGAAPRQAAPATRDLDPAERKRLAELERLMREERLYRQDRLSIGEVAHRMGVAEYRLRRLINQSLGERNFNAFLNRFRIEEAKTALADPGQAEVPILTIALDAGFNSLGPFNRAFKADTGATPSDYRRTQLGGDLPNSKLGAKRASG